MLVSPDEHPQKGFLKVVINIVVFFLVLDANSAKPLRVVVVWERVLIFEHAIVEGDEVKVRTDNEVFYGFPLWKRSREEKEKILYKKICICY